MATEVEKKQAQRILKAKGRLLWRLITNTPGIADLATHLEKETTFDALPRDEQITALVIVSHYEQGARGIEEEASKRAEAAQETAGTQAPAQTEVKAEAPAAPVGSDDPTPPPIASGGEAG